jgi:hypothetical protein
MKPHDLKSACKSLKTNAPNGWGQRCSALPLPIKSAISKITANINIRRTTVDLLLQNPETKRRYEVEIQLGATDEAHIIRTIEYWDIEKKL